MKSLSLRGKLVEDELAFGMRLQARLSGVVCRNDVWPGVCVGSTRHVNLQVCFSSTSDGSTWMTRSPDRGIFFLERVAVARLPLPVATRAKAE